MEMEVRRSVRAFRFVRSEDPMSTDVYISIFARAETDVAIKKLHDLAGRFGRWFHLRQPVPLACKK